MGSKLSPNSINTSIKSLNLEVPFLVEYVDDTILSIPTDNK